MEFVQGKDSFNEMATGILVKLFAGYPSHSEFDYSDWGWNDERSELLRNTLFALRDMGYIQIISSTDMDYAAKLTPRGLNLLQQQAPGAGDAVINILKGAAGETRSAVIGAIISWIFGGK